MIDIILLFLDLTLFLLSFVYLIRDAKSYEGEETSEFKSNVLPKHSQYALMFGLLALVLAVVNSLFYV